MLKLAFLFLVITDVYHQPYWQLFFKEHQEQCSLYVHAKEVIPKTSYFKPYEIPVKVPTSWANSVEAQVALLREALKDPANEKFVFVSESTIPLQSFDMVYKTIMAGPESIFYYTKSPHSSIHNKCYAYRSLQDIPQEFRYKTSQWVILNRKHAELVVNDEIYLKKIIQYQADNELFFGTLLASQNLLHEVLPVDKTYVDWQKPNEMRNKNDRLFPHDFDDIDDEYNANQIVNMINNEVLFMRKFSKNTALPALEPYLAYCPPNQEAPPLKVGLYNRCVKERYALIRSVLDTYTTPITVLDCGARQGYYCYHIACDYRASCVLWEAPDPLVPDTKSRLLDVHNHIYNNHNVLLFNSPIDRQVIYALSACTTFDIILAFDVIGLFGRYWHNILQALLTMGHNIIVEVPEDATIEVVDLRYYLAQQHAVRLGEVQEHAKTMSTLYLLQNNHRAFALKAR